MSRLQRLLVSLCLAALLPAVSVAENGGMAESQTQPAQVVGAMPTRGMTMEQVKQHFGQPERRFEPVGDPPITRWQYDGMMIYFEHQYVIHSVATNNNHK